MSDQPSTSLQNAIEGVYTCLHNNNIDLDQAIAALKRVMTEGQIKEVSFEPKRLAQNNRSGRKLMQAYFRKRGVTVCFSESENTIEAKTSQG